MAIALASHHRFKWVPLHWLLHGGVMIALSTLPLVGGFGFYGMQALALWSVVLGLSLGYRDGLGSAFGTALYSLARQGVLFISVSALVLGGQTLLFGACDLTTSFTFLVVLPLPSFLLALSLGAILRLLCKERWPSLGWVFICAVPLLSLSGVLLRFYTSPAIFIADHLLGYWPGSLYDEYIPIDSRLLGFRLMTGCWFAVAVCVYEWLRRWVLLGGWLLPSWVLALVVGGWGLDQSAGRFFQYRVSDSDLRQELSVVRNTKGLTVYLPTDTDPILADQVLADHIFYLDRLRSTLNVALQKPIESFVFKNEAHKAAWVGASGTSFVKPWKSQLIIDTPRRYHPILGHELVHAVAAEWNSSLLGVPMKGGVIPNLVLIEGLAVALSPMQRVSPNVYAATLLSHDALPRLDAFLAPLAFWSASSGSSYRIAGSFIGYLLDRYGAEPLKRWYAGASFREAYGSYDFAELESGWHQALRQVELKSRDKNQAQRIIQRQPIFGRKCPERVAALRAQLRHAPTYAKRTLFRRLCDAQYRSVSAQIEWVLHAMEYPSMHSEVKDMIELLFAEALHVYEELSLVQARLYLAWKDGQQELRVRLQERYRRLAESHAESTHRHALAAEWIWHRPTAEQKTIVPFLFGYANNRIRRDAVSVLTRLASQGDAVATYLLFRQLSDPESQAYWLAALVQAEFEDRVMNIERMRMLARASDAIEAYDIWAEDAEALDGYAETFFYDPMHWLARWESLADNATDLDTLLWQRRRTLWRRSKATIE